MTNASASRSDVLALDVGGAAIKAADGGGWSASDAFAMWREWRHLVSTLARLVGPRNPRRVVATMTGEIADCFPSRAAGVAHIVGAVVEAAEACGCRAQGIYLTDGRIVTPAEACAKPLAAAASNWHAVARLAAARVAAGPALLVDIGSTTTDVVPIADGAVTPLARDDAGRMMSGELVYTGVERTPVAAIVRSLPHRGMRRVVASERFAESRDVWLVLGELAEAADSGETADGGPATRDAARVRLARSMLVEPAAVSADDARAAAAWCAEVQARQIARALSRVAAACGSRPRTIVVSGHGERLARMAVARTGWDVDIASLSAELGPAVSRSAPAHALALIARGKLP
jgi:hypothetical protein